MVSGQGIFTWGVGVPSLGLGSETGWLLGTVAGKSGAGNRGGPAIKMDTMQVHGIPISKKVARQG